MEKEIVINSFGIEIYNLPNIEDYDIDFVVELEMFKLRKTFLYYKRAFLPSPFEDNLNFSLAHLYHKRNIEKFDSPVWVFEEYFLVLIVII